MLGTLVDLELKDVGARIVADGVEIVLAANDLGGIDFGYEDGFSFGVGAGKEVAERVDDATATTADDGVRLGVEGRFIVSGEVAAALELVAGEHETAAFDRDVAHGG